MPTRDRASMHLDWSEPASVLRTYLTKRWNVPNVPCPKVVRWQDDEWRGGVTLSFQPRYLERVYAFFNGVASRSRKLRLIDAYFPAVEGRGLLPRVLSGYGAETVARSLRALPRGSATPMMIGAARRARAKERGERYEPGRSQVFYDD